MPEHNRAWFHPMPNQIEPMTRSKIVDTFDLPELRDIAPEHLPIIEGLRYGGKPPMGFWYQIGDSWEQWCAYNMPEWLHDYRLNLEVDTSRFALLLTPEDMRLFFEKYAMPSSIRYVAALDWSRIMKDFDGIEIPNYEHGWSFSFDGCEWSYGWDIPSGVCWNAKKCVKVLNVEAREQ